MEPWDSLGYWQDLRFSCGSRTVGGASYWWPRYPRSSPPRSRANRCWPAPDADIHGRCGTVHSTVVPHVSARWVVRQTHARQRFDQRPIAQYLTKQLGTKRTMLSVVIASAVVTYGGVSVFVAFFVLVPMAQEMFRAPNIPRRLLPAAVGLGAFTFTMSVMPGTPSVNNAIPMPYLGTTTFAAPRAEHHRVDHHLPSSACGGSGVSSRPRTRPAKGYGSDPENPPVIDEKDSRTGGTGGQLRPG